MRGRSGGEFGRKSRVILGAMSGTSADGVDVAAVSISGGKRHRVKLMGLASIAFPRKLRERIGRIRAEGGGSLRELASLGRDLTRAYAMAAKLAMVKAGVSSGEIACIAAHGQTLFHEPPLTIQWFDPALLAALTGCQVISDFRRADCAVGGQGAPLVPYADWIMFGDQRKSRVLLNVGGIANITYLPAGGKLEEVIAFDTGPGNCISDGLARRWLGTAFDAGGEMAEKGGADEVGVERFLGQGYFRRKWPKSTDGPAMIGLFESCVVRRADRPRSAQAKANRLATACLCCARAVARGIAMLPGDVDEVVAAGGGMRNRAIARMLAEETGLPIRTTEEFGVPIEAREAMAFALLADATLEGKASNVPSVTGARKAVVLGSLTFANP